MFSIKTLYTKQVFICLFFLCLSVVSLLVYPVMESFGYFGHYHGIHSRWDHKHDDRYPNKEFTAKKKDVVTKQEIDKIRNDLQNDLRNKQMEYETKLNKEWLQKSE